MKHYDGRRTTGGVRVTVNSRPLNPRLDLRNHSPTGFEWGYGGSGPAQLALAILADCVGDELALQHYQEFKQAVIELLPRRHWTLPSGQIEEVVKTLRSSLSLSSAVPSNHHHIKKGCNETP